MATIMGAWYVNVLAIDPGTTQSAWAVVRGGGTVTTFGKEPNETLLEAIRDKGRGWHTVDCLIVEGMTSYGKPVGTEVFETLVWTGRFLEAWEPGESDRISRRDVKKIVCGTTHSRDSDVRRCIIERYTEDGMDAIGTKKEPGPLYGVAGDVWSAIAVGLAWKER
ncbi:MAG: hypothetical protein CL928_04915 [Deltaproteobacteria bacterium]|nr:hypothetical protein [Deltaproteobacteria bacterium]|tara:strand:- start:285 stop:779 length:495 start_codon:yes stop_codon:yes gene_type:complete